MWSRSFRPLHTHYGLRAVPGVAGGVAVLIGGLPLGAAEVVAGAPLCLS